MLKIILSIGGIQVLAVAINVVRSKAIALMLGPERIGLISVIDQYVQLISYIAAFSLPFAAVRFLSRAHSENQDRFRVVYSAFLSVILILSLIGTSAGILIVVMAPEWFGDELSENQPILLIAFLSVPGMMLGGFITNALAAAQKVRASALIAVITGLGTTIAWITGISISGIQGMYIGSAITLSAIAIAGIIYLRSSLDLPITIRFSAAIREFTANPEIFYVAMIFASGAIFSSASLLVMRQAVLTAHGPAAAGLLQSAFAVSLAIGLVLTPTNGLFLTPVMNRNIEKTEKLATASEYQRRLAIILIIVSLPAVLFPKTLIFILFSQEFTPAAQWLYLFVATQVIVQYAGIYQAVLIGVNDLWRYCLMTCGGFAITAGSSMLLASEYGVAGAGFSLLLGASFTALTCLFLLKKRHGLEVSLAHFSLPLYSIGIPILVGFVARIFPEWGLSSLAARSLIGLIIATGVWGLISPEDRNGIIALGKRLQNKA